MTLRSTALRMASSIGFLSTARYMNRRLIPVLMYHGFTKEGLEGDHYEPLHINEQDFKGHLKFLSDHYRVISLRELVKAIAAGSSLPQRSAVITIDDGYESVHEIAAPLLHEFGVPATVFLCTDFVNGLPLYHDRIEYAVKNCANDQLVLNTDSLSGVFPLDSEDARYDCYSMLMKHVKKAPHSDWESLLAGIEDGAGAALEITNATHADYRPMSWDQARDLADSHLIEIGNHTRSHAILTNCTSVEMSDEVVAGHDEIRQQLGAACDLFCYPNGTEADFNDETRALLSANGYVCGLTAVQGPVRSGDDPLELNRYFARNDVLELEASISGLIGTIKTGLNKVTNGFRR